MMRSTFAQSAKFIFIEIIGDIFYFPVWWYTSGAKGAFKNFLLRVHNAQKSLALLIWVKNIFKPMFGQYDWQGRIISFFMRLAQILFRSALFLLAFGGYFLLFLLWLAFPIFVVWMIAIHSKY